MCTIMKNIHKYIPKPYQQVVYEGEKAAVEEEFFQGILFGGDQLTVCQCRGAQAAWCNDDVAVEHLDGITPVTEDWHAKLTLMGL